ncbi:MAG: hypothetical protein GY865_00020 [candidate division Zixibacteria bacterium]|nr:hypothetical protein [candidate division Zixibacteria bacterium]
MFSKLVLILTYKRLPIVAAFFSVLLLTGTIWQGLRVDDYHHRAAIIDPDSGGYCAKGDPVHLFAFMDGEPQHTKKLIEKGHAPWWTDPEVKISFFRPLSVLTHLLDYKLWPDHPELMHAQNLLWLFALVIAVGLFYRRLFSKGSLIAAGLALMLFAFDDAHVETVSWIAQRNALIAMFFGVLALITYHKNRVEGWKPGAYLSPVLFSLAILAGEAGITTMAYLIPYTIFLDSRKWSERVQSLLPFFIIILIWRIGTTMAGFSVENMDYYINPTQHPLDFILTALFRLPILITGLFTPISASLALYGPPETSLQLFLLGCMVVILLAAIFWPLLRKDKNARFFATATLLALVPSCAVGPSNRLLIWSSLGIMGFLSCILISSFSRESIFRPTSRFLRVLWGSVSILIVIVHLLIAPALRPILVNGSKELRQKVYVSLPNDPTLSEQSVIIVNGPLVFAASHLQVMQAAENLPVPKHTRILSPSFASVELNRPDDYTLILHPDGGYLIDILDALVCSRDKPFIVGHRVELSDLNIKVLSITSDGRPESIACQFRVPLEDNSLRWIFWQDGRYKSWTLPKIGQKVKLPPSLLF